MSENPTSTISVKTVKFDDFGGMYDCRFDHPVNVVIRDGTAHCCIDMLVQGGSAEWNDYVDEVTRSNVVSLHIENPDVFSSSEDGRFVFATDPESGECWLVSCIGKEEDVAVPEGVYGVLGRTFSRNEYVKTVRLPASVRKVDEKTFSHVQDFGARIPGNSIAGRNCPSHIKILHNN